MARIKGILFDLGGTLLDFGPVRIQRLFTEGARLAYAYLKKLGQPLPRFRLFRLKQLWAVRLQYLKSRLIRREFNSLDLLGRLCERMGHTLTPEQTKELAWLWYKPLGDCATVEEGVRELLRGFRSDGLRLGLVSNTFIPGQVLDRHLGQLGLLEFFPWRIYSCDVLYRKPHPRIFGIALERLGIAAEEAVFVGDSPLADVAGAVRVGMVSVLKDPTGRSGTGQVRPTHRIRSLRELPGIIRAYNEDTTGG